MLATLVDWNDLPLFENIVPLCKQFVVREHYRDAAFTCIGSFVGKGMPELDKLGIMVKMEYLPILKSIQINYCKDKNQQSNTGAGSNNSEAEEEELRFLEAVVRSVSFLGRWTLSFQSSVNESFPQ